MRITDCRYDRDRLRLDVAFRLIGHEARTRTIRLATQLSDDRIRRLYREYVQADPGFEVRRRRGRSPRQMSHFRRSLVHEFQAATLASMLRCCGLLARNALFRHPEPADVALFCDIYETYQKLCLNVLISFEHAWYLTEVLARNDEFLLTPCPDCDAYWVRDSLSLLPYNCAACRSVGTPRLIDSQQPDANCSSGC